MICKFLFSIRRQANCTCISFRFFLVLYIKYLVYIYIYTTQMIRVLVISYVLIYLIYTVNQGYPIL